ncbi:MAG: arginine deiminase-related protein [Bacteroidia bacterium]
MQATSNIFLVRPSTFAFNTETAASNAFQNPAQYDVQRKALNEFDGMVNLLKAKGINVFVFDDTPFPSKPDAIFPNNWITLHADGTVVLYPMFAPNRRLERRMDIVNSLRMHFDVKNVIDLSGHEKENRFLEGTGSIVFDHNNKIAYASVSCRTDKDILIKLSEKLGYEPIVFHAVDKNGQEIYHTNVVMCIAEKFAVVCLDAICYEEERANIINRFASSAHYLINITFEQMNGFAGNMLQVKSKVGKNILVLSETAFKSLNAEQKNKLAEFVELLPCSINTIETIGGGSARCMIAEIFLSQPPAL